MAKGEIISITRAPRSGRSLRTTVHMVIIRQVGFKEVKENQMEIRA